MSREHAQVLIAGGGSVGLSTALALCRQGIRPVVLERRHDTFIHPRSTGVQPPAREFFRCHGLTEQMRRASAPLAGSLTKFTGTTLAGTDLATVPRVPVPPAETLEITRRISPADVGPCAQDQIDRALLDAVLDRGATVRFDSQVDGVSQDDTGVTVAVTDRAGDGRYDVRADYVIAADGASSRIRSAIGATMNGPQALGPPMIHVLFDADLGDLVKDNVFQFAELRGTEYEGLLLSINNRDRWVYHRAYDPTTESPADFSEQRCIELVRGVTGVPDLKVAIRAVLPWQMAGRVTDRMRVGRVFLAGDAAHVIPPVGGFGMSTGIADGYNLAWKLALVLDGHAGTGLLDSYQDERLPVGTFTRDQAVARFRHMELHWKGDRTELAKVEIVDPLVTGFGYQYHSHAIIGPRTTLPSHTNVEANLDGHPGTRLPHTWLTPTHSTLDLTGPHFALLTGPDNHHWTTATTHTPIPITTHPITDPTWLTTTGLQPTGALLVRPDNIIAWRAPTTPHTPTEALHNALTRILDR